MCMCVKGRGPGERRAPKGEASSTPPGFKFRWKLSLRSPSSFTVETGAGGPRGRRSPAHLAAARPGAGAGQGRGWRRAGRGWRRAGRCGAGRAALPWPGRAGWAPPRLSPARAPEGAGRAGASPGPARRCPRLTHRRKVALRPSPVSSFLPPARLWSWSRAGRSRAGTCERRPDRARSRLPLPRGA